MMRLFSLALLIVFVAFMVSPRLRSWLKARAPMLVLGVIGGAAVFFAVTGRLNWIFGAIGAALPVLWRLGGLLRFLPLMGRSGGARANQQQKEAPRGKMTPEEAAELLGVTNDASKEDILSAHRRLMQKIHPDRGGTDYLAAQLNAARDSLLKHRSAS